MGISHDNGAEVQGQSQNRVAREICHHNRDTCEELESVPQEGNNYHKEAWVWEGGYLALALPLPI